jgi:hypothetical protein
MGNVAPLRRLRLRGRALDRIVIICTLKLETHHHGEGVVIRIRVRGVARQDERKMRCSVFAERVWSILISGPRGEPLELIQSLAAGEARALAESHKRWHPEHQVEVFTQNGKPRAAEAGSGTG